MRIGRGLSRAGDGEPQDRRKECARNRRCVAPCDPRVRRSRCHRRLVAPYPLAPRRGRIRIGSPPMLVRVEPVWSRTTRRFRLRLSIARTSVAVASGHSFDDVGLAQRRQRCGIEAITAYAQAQYHLRTRSRWAISCPPFGGHGIAFTCPRRQALRSPPYWRRGRHSPAGDAPRDRVQSHRRNPRRVQGFALRHLSRRRCTSMHDSAAALVTAAPPRPPRPLGYAGRSLAPRAAGPSARGASHPPDRAWSAPTTGSDRHRRGG